MQDRSARRWGVAAGVVAIAVSAGSAIAWWGWQSGSRSLPSPATVQSSPQSLPPVHLPSVQSPPVHSPPAMPPPDSLTRPRQSEPRVAIAAEKTLQVYWLKGTGDRIELVPRPVRSLAKPSGIPLEAALNELLTGPNQTALTTTIPAATQLRSVFDRADGVHIDLSREFKTGGGTASMTARVAQVLYTATSQRPTAKVWLSVEGKPLETLGGEGLMLEQPISRQSFERDFSL